MAVEHGKGAMLVLAGPGSGKTAVITERVRWLVEHEKVPPEKILVITFSRAAAVHMKKRFEVLTSHQYSSVNFGTFHAIFFNIIKTESHYDHTNIISEEERFRILRERMHELRANFDKERELLEQVSSAISAVKAGSVRLRDVHPHPLSDEDFADLYRTYCAYLAGEGKLDFDDMMTKCAEIFEDSPGTLKVWQEKYRYILIDEFQDINSLQYRLVKLLALPENNFFAVGDDDQSIYGFRGARPDIMFEFERDFKGCRRILLGVNYRSHSEIIESAVNLVKHNKKRFAKRLESNAGEGGTCAYMRFDTMEEANLHIANALQKRRDAGRKLSEVAVLFRMRHEVTGLHRLLQKRNIPCRLGEKLPCIFDHMIAEDMVAYLRLARGEHSRAELLRVINRPNRYVTRQSIQAAGAAVPAVSAERYGRTAANGLPLVPEDNRGRAGGSVTLEKLIYANRGKEYVRERLEHLARQLDFMRRMDVRTAIRFIRKALGYDEWLKTYSKEKGVALDELLDIAGELEASAEGCETLEEWLTEMEEYRAAMRMPQRSGNSASGKEENVGKSEPEDGVALMTFHASKGLEFETVFVIDLVEGSVPSNRAKTEEQIEEERRALYVALTRAKKELYVLSSRERLGRTPDESRFVKEMFREGGKRNGRE
ncbi:MAG: ATP-dependent helicase [Lachnospiraceae bacterium]|nr:ATP-dependent helicase [Lachnospiraceae bacterium]